MDQEGDLMDPSTFGPRCRIFLRCARAPLAKLEPLPAYKRKNKSCIHRWSMTIYIPMSTNGHIC